MGTLKDYRLSYLKRISVKDNAQGFDFHGLALALFDDPPRQAGRDSNGLGGGQTRGNIGRGNISGETGAHIESCVCLGDLNRPLLLNKTAISGELEAGKSSGRRTVLPIASIFASHGR